MRYIKTIISIMIIALILTACTQENSNEGILNASDEWSAKLINQPPVILFDYDKNDNKDRFAFDYVLYDMQLQERKKEYICTVPYNKSGGGIYFSKDRTRIMFASSGGKGAADVDLVTGDVSFVELGENIDSPKYVNENVISYIKEGKIYVYKKNQERHLLIGQCQQPDYNLDTYDWFSDGKSILYVSKQEDGDYALAKKNLIADTSEVLLKHEKQIYFKLSNSETKVMLRCNGKLYLYDMETNTILNIELPDIYESRIYSICFSPDDKFIAFSCVIDDGSYLNSYEIWIVEIDTLNQTMIYNKKKASEAAVVW